MEAKEEEYRQGFYQWRRSKRNIDLGFYLWRRRKRIIDKGFTNGDGGRGI
jgi:hypothetical protein